MLGLLTGIEPVLQFHYYYGITRFKIYCRFTIILQESVSRAFCSNKSKSDCASRFGMPTPQYDTWLFAKDRAKLTVVYYVSGYLNHPCSAKYFKSL